MIERSKWACPYFPLRGQYVFVVLTWIVYEGEESAFCFVLFCFKDWFLCSCHLPYSIWVLSTSKWCIHADILTQHGLNPVLFHQKDRISIRNSITVMCILQSLSVKAILPIRYVNCSTICFTWRWLLFLKHVNSFLHSRREKFSAT